MRRGVPQNPETCTSQTIHGSKSKSVSTARQGAPRRAGVPPTRSAKCLTDNSALSCRCSLTSYCTLRAELPFGSYTRPRTLTFYTEHAGISSSRRCPRDRRARFRSIRGVWTTLTAREDVALARATGMVDSFKRVGFVYLVNHGIPKDKIRTMFDWVRLAQTPLDSRLKSLLSAIERPYKRE